MREPNGSIFVRRIANVEKNNEDMISLNATMEKKVHSYLLFALRRVVEMIVGAVEQRARQRGDSW